MTLKYIQYTIFLLAAIILLAGVQPVNAAVVHGRSYLAPGNAFWPEGNALGTGKLKFFPEIAVGLEYSDNIYYDETETESDTITHIFPRLRLDYSLEERGRISFGYGGNFAYYSDFSDNDWQRHDFGLLLNYRAPAGLFLNVTNDYVITGDPFGSSDDYGIGEQKDRWYNLLGVELGYEHANMLRIIGYFNYRVQEYDNREVDYSQDFDDLEFGAGLEKRFSEKTWGFARYFHGTREYPTNSPEVDEDELNGDDGQIEVNQSNNADYTSDWIDVGLTWDPTSRITGRLGFGYEWIEYDNPIDPNGSPYQDTESWIASTRIDYSIKPNVTDMHLTFNRRNYQRASDTTENYDGTYLNVFFNHRFYTWFKLLLNFGIGRNDYNYGRTDDDIRAGISLEYLVLRRLTLALGYDYTNRDSSEEGESFTVNRVLGTVTLRY